MFARQYSDKITDNTVIDGIPYTLYSEDGVFMVKAVNICDWLGITYGDDWSKHPDYETSGKDLMVWCESNNSHYYGGKLDGLTYSIQTLGNPCGIMGFGNKLYYNLFMLSQRLNFSYSLNS